MNTKEQARLLQPYRIDQPMAHKGERINNQGHYTHKSEAMKQQQEAGTF